MEIVRSTKAATPSLLKEEEKPEDSESELTLFFCENTDALLDPMEQMTYALNETQIKYGSIVVLKNAP